MSYKIPVRAQLLALAAMAVLAGTGAAAQPAPADGGSSEAPAVPQPSPDPTNFEGIWQPDFVPPLVNAGEGTSGALSTTDRKPLPYNDRGSAIFQYRVKMEQAGTPIANSVSQYLPAIPVYQLDLFLGQLGVVQDKKNVVVLFEDGSSWQIHLDRGHPASLTPSYKGDSVGRFEGSTLVVDSIGFNTKTWLDSVGSPHTAKLHLTTRISKIDGGRKLEFLSTYEDPDLYTAPFTVRRTASYRPDGQLLESEVENLRPENNANLIYEDN